MSQLSSTVKTTRRIIIGFIIFSVVVIIAQFIGSEIPDIVGNDTGTVIDDCPYQSPTINAANYKRLNLESLTTLNSSAPQVLLNGTFDSYPCSANIYYYQEKSINLSSREKARRQAEILRMQPNFESNEEKTVYTWRDNFNTKSFIFNARDHSIQLISNLSEATNNPIDVDNITNEELINTTQNIIGELEIDELGFENATFEVDYVDVDSNGDLISTENSLRASLARVTVFKNLEIATPLSGTNANTQNTLQTTPTEDGIDVTSGEIHQRDILNGSLTLIYNGNDSLPPAENPNEDQITSGIDTNNIVYLEYIPYNLQQNPVATTAAGQQTNSSGTNISSARKDVVSVIEVGTAFDKIETGQPGTYLVYLNRKDTNIYDEYEPLSVSKYTINASSTRLIYVEPKDFDFLNENEENESTTPSNPRLFPFYWLEGTATLEDGGLADFVFLVDPVPR